jgi:hypothetical protein
MTACSPRLSFEPRHFPAKYHLSRYQKRNLLLHPSVPRFYKCSTKVSVSQASSTYIGDLFFQGKLCQSHLICDSCRQPSMPYPITEDSHDDKLQGDIFQESAQSPSESKCIPTQSGTESGRTTCGSGHDYFYPHRQIQGLDPVVGLVTSSTPQLPSLLSPASSPRPTILSLPDLSMIKVITSISNQISLV